MRDQIKKNLKLLKISFGYNLSRELENRNGLFLQIGFIIFNDALFLIQLAVFLSLKSTIGGYRPEDWLMLWAILSTVYGLSHLFFENIFNIPNLITAGKLDAYITQPTNILWSVAISKINVMTFGDLIFGVILAFVSAGTDFYKIILFVVVSSLGAIIFTAFFALIGSLSFWLKRGEQIASSLEFTTLTICTYPEGIFNSFIRGLLYFALPIGFAYYMPLKIVQDFNLASLTIVVLAALLLSGLAFFVFHKGLERYSSSNLINTRV